MIKPRQFFRWIAFAFMAFSVASASAFDHAHKLYEAVLQNRVSDRGVDYAALKADNARLREYLDEIANFSEADFKAWTRPQQLALLLNLYNAATLNLIVDHYPVKSIRKIGGFFGNPWKLDVVRLWGKTHSLDWLEHEIIRPRYQDPRIHFALVCAAKGCPPLRREPYVAERLDDQLDDQVRTFLGQESKNRLDAEMRVLHLSPIFDWYREDFVGPGKGLADYVRRYFKTGDSRILDDPKLKIAFTEYDWTLNDLF